jgi:rhodanese-related sulfurtransferase
MHRAAPAPFVDLHVDDGDVIKLGELAIQVLATPGHPPDSVCLFAGGCVFSGDTLLIRGTGRADLAGGDPGVQYDSITRRLLALPDETVVLPAHDYRGNERSTIGEERRLNPRIAGRSHDEYVGIMAGLGLPLPERIQEVLQPNQTAIDDDRITFPSIAQLAEVRQLAPAEVAAMLDGAAPPLILDVREPEEWQEEGHSLGALSMPLRELAGRCGELDAWRHGHFVAVCRAGVRSTTAAAILTSLDFENVSNMKGGMLAWVEAGLPVGR